MTFQAKFYSKIWECFYKSSQKMFNETKSHLYFANALTFRLEYLQNGIFNINN
jgi:hypothetical protein